MKKILKYLSLYQVLLRNKGLPNYLIFYVTALCNSKCKTCFNWKFNKTVVKNELTLDEINKMSKKMKVLKYVTLGGGEPFLRNDLDKICEIFYKNNNTRIFSIPTNALSPKRIFTVTELILKKCPESIVRLSLSIDGINEQHDHIRGVKGNFKKVIETYNLIKKFKKKYNFELMCNTTFSSYNQNNIKEIYNFIKKKFEFDYYSVTLVRGDSREFLAKNVDYEKYKEFVNFLEKEYFKEKKEKNKNPIINLLELLPIFTRRGVVKTLKSEKRFYKCYAGKKFIVIDSFGNLFPCEMLNKKFGNLRDYDYDLKKILKGTGEKKKENKEILKFINDKKCNCTWECAIQHSLILNIKRYPIYLKSLIKKTYT